jgi:hypothetical protein
MIEGGAVCLGNDQPRFALALRPVQRQRDLIAAPAGLATHCASRSLRPPLPCTTEPAADWSGPWRGLLRLRLRLGPRLLGLGLRLLRLREGRGGWRHWNVDPELAATDVRSPPTAGKNGTQSADIAAIGHEEVAGVAKRDVHLLDPGDSRNRAQMRKRAIVGRGIRCRDTHAVRRWSLHRAGFCFHIVFRRRRAAVRAG